MFPHSLFIASSSERLGNTLVAQPLVGRAIIDQEFLLLISLSLNSLVAMLEDFCEATIFLGSTSFSSSGFDALILKKQAPSLA